MIPQPTPATLYELRRQGLPSGDIARMLRLHPQAVLKLINGKNQ